MTFRFIVGFLCLVHAVSGQNAELDKRNGFKDIKMASIVTNYEGLEFKKAIEDEEFPEAGLYTAKKGFYENIGNLRIFDLEVKVYKDSIFEIRVVTEKEPNLYKGLKKAFGEPKFNYVSNQYYWSSEKLRLSYSSHSSNKIEMIYRSYLMSKKLKKERKEVVEAISTDF